VISYRIDLPGRGTTRVWECTGPRGAATLVLLHGVAFTAELNWGSTLESLGRHFRVIAFDQRGHGDGISAGPRFRLEDCADDVAELARTLGIPRCHVVGYSMGGMVAQLVYRRHPGLLSGLVLCATARSVQESSMDDLVALGLPVLAAAMHWNSWSKALSAEAVSALVLGRIDDAGLRARVRRQLQRTDLRTVLSAVRAVRAFSSDGWIDQVDVPTAVVVTTQDRIVPPSRQRGLAAAIPGAVVVELDADHGACVTAPERFAGLLLDACRLIDPGTAGVVDLAGAARASIEDGRPLSER
jgi:3-oxoadipate enol-lactonase